MAKNKDIYVNKFYGTVTESAANTLTFAQISTNVNVFDKIAWVVHRLEWYLTPATLAAISGDADSLAMALCSSNTLTSLALSDAAVIDLIETTITHIGTSANSVVRPQPMIHDFSALPGGGLIIAPRPLYVAAKGASLGAAQTAQVRGYFTRLDMSPDEYIELIDYYRIVS